MQPPAGANAPLLLDPPRVLVVDDDEGTLLALQALLEPLGANICTARSGGEALAALADAEFAVVLLDVGLPNPDGFEVAEAIRARPLRRHLPVIFLTGHTDESELRRGYALGAADYLFKPIDPDILRAKVSVFVELARLRDEAALLTHRALHDQLTGLPNRTLFLDRLEQALGRIEREPGRVSVLFLDLDGFKEINDTYGHDAGDRILVETAQQLQAVIRATDTAARFGGDEFLVLCEQSPEADLEGLVERICSRLERPREDLHIRLTATVGHASTEDPRTRTDELVRAADQAMLARKAARTLEA